MTTELSLAFDNLEARAKASAGLDPLDRISLRDHIVEVEIGAFQSERGTTQRICFNVVVEVRSQQNALSDDVDRILSYDSISNAISAELAAERLNLLETLASRLAERVLAEPQAEKVFVRIQKLDRGPGALGVEIVRSKKEVEEASTKALDLRAEIPVPLIVWMSNEAIVSSNLTGWLDTLEKTKKPVVLCVDLFDGRIPKSQLPDTQFHIDLLGLEQNAWMLAGRDDRCSLVGTRTELDWALRNGQITAWAPSKMVLDAVDGPFGNERSPFALATWLASELGSRQLMVVGEAKDVQRDLEVTVVAPDNPDLF